MEDFTFKDFKDTYESLLDIIEKSTDRWHPTTSSEADPGVVLLKQFALKHDSQQYAFDMARSQGFLDTVSNRQDAFDLLQMLGYEMSGAASATGFIFVTYTGEGTGTLPRFTSIADVYGAEKYFTVKEVPGIGATGKDVPIMEGNIFRIRKEGVDEFTLKDVDEDGRFFLGQYGLAENGVFVLSVGEGGDEVDEWSISSATTLMLHGKYYYIRTTDTGENYIQFPEDFDTLLRDISFVVYATFTLGKAGTVSAGTLVKAVNVAGGFNVSQLVPTVGGKDVQSISDAVKDYYNTKEVFGTIVSKHDYEAALNAITVSGKRLFSACWADTDLSRTLLVKARAATLAYIHYTYDTTPVSQIDALGLKSSLNYFESYVPDDSVNSSTAVADSLQQNKVIGSRVVLKNSPRILAVTRPKGQIVSSRPSAEILSNVLQRIQDSYNASNNYFGREIDYAQLLALIKGASAGISNVMLDRLEYQVYLKYKEVDGEPDAPILESTGDVSKTLVAAKAVLSGIVPAFKFLNRSNVSTDYDSSKNYVTAVLGTTGFKTLFPSIANLDASSITVTNINNGSKQQFSAAGIPAGSGDITLIQNQVLQFSRPKMVSDLDYGLGVRYMLTIPESADVSVGSGATITAGSMLKENSIIYVVSGDTISFGTTTGQISTDSGSTWGEGGELGNVEYVAGKAVKLGQDYNVLSIMRMGPDSVIVSGSKIVTGSTVDDTAHPVTPADGEQHTLADNESLTVYPASGSSSVIYNTGKTIMFVGGSGVANKETTLTGIKKISILKDEIYIIPTDYLYFMKLNGSWPAGKNLADGYTLDDGEYFIYTRPSKDGYIQLGTGTYLKAAGATANFTKIISTSAPTDTSYFESVPFEVTATLNEISTFQKGTVFRYVPKDGSDTDELPIDWEDIPDGESIEILDKSGGEVTQTFDDTYKVRLPLVLISEIDGTLAVPYPQSFDLTVADTTEGVTTDSPPLNDITYLSLSSPVFVPLTSDGQKFMPLTTGPVLIGRYKPSLVKYSVPAEHTRYVIDIVKNGVKIEIKAAITTGSSISIPFPLIERTKMVLCHANIVWKGGNGTNTVAFSVLENAATENTEATGYTDSILDIHTEEAATYNYSTTTMLDTTLKISAKEFHSLAGGEQILIKFTGDGFGGTVITLDTISYVADFSDEVKYIETASGEALHSSALDYYNPQIPEIVSPAYFPVLTGTEAGAVLYNKILDLDTADKFDWLCIPSNDFQHPTASNSYFHPKHPYNLKTIPYISVGNIGSKLTVRR